MHVMSAAHMPRNQRTRIPTDKAAAAGVLFCCKQEGRVNHEAMKIITKDLAGTKRGQNKTGKKTRWLTSDQKPSPTRPTGRTPNDDDDDEEAARFQVSPFSSPF
jgi:hypothetical protein